MPAKVIGTCIARGNCGRVKVYLPHGELLTETEVNMSPTTVEERVAALERTVAELVQSRQPAGRTKDWTRTVGMFSGNQLMKQIDAAGQQIRERDRQSARRSKRRRARK